MDNDGYGKGPPVKDDDWVQEECLLYGLSGGLNTFWSVLLLPEWMYFWAI